MTAAKNQRGEVRMPEEGRVTIWRLAVATPVVLIPGVFLFEPLSIFEPLLLFILLTAGAG